MPPTSLDPALRLALSRWTVGAAVIRYTAHLPDSAFFAEQRPFAPGPPRPRRRRTGNTAPAPRTTARRVRTLKALTLAAVGTWTAGIAPRTSGAVATGAFALLNREVAYGLPGFASYTSHLNIMLATLAASDTHRRLSLARPRPDTPRQVRLRAAQTALAQLFVATVYTQSGLSKLLHAGSHWIKDATTLRHALALYGTPTGRALSRQEALMPVLSAAAVAFEAGFLPALVLVPGARPLLGLSALAFHGTVKKTMDISFWHLAWLNAPLFLDPPRALARITVDTDPRPNG